MPRKKKKYPYDSNEAVKALGATLNDICPSPQSGAVVVSHSPMVDTRPQSYCTELPGSVWIIENNLAYIPSAQMGLEALASSTYLFIRAIKGIGAANIVLYMPAAPLTDKLPPVVAVEDHINMLARPPHIGVETASWEEQFFPMNKAYDPVHALRSMEIAGLKPVSGVLLGVGPGQFDTNAGHEAAKRIGADLISVHIFGQCLIAKRAGMNVIGFAETSGIDPEITGRLISRAL